MRHTFFLLSNSLTQTLVLTTKDGRNKKRVRLTERWAKNSIVKEKKRRITMQMYRIKTNGYCESLKKLMMRGITPRLPEWECNDRNPESRLASFGEKMESGQLGICTWRDLLNIIKWQNLGSKGIKLVQRKKRN